MIEVLNIKDWLAAVINKDGVIFRVGDVVYIPGTLIKTEINHFFLSSYTGSKALFMYANLSRSCEIRGRSTVLYGLDLKYRVDHLIKPNG